MSNTEGAAIEWVESGTGRCLLLVPGSFATAAAWRGVGALLQDRFRVVATSLPGYGATSERRPQGDDAIDHLAEAVEDAVVRTGTAPVLVGHSFGGTVALAVALRARVPIGGLVLFEANPIDLLRAAGDTVLHDDVAAFRRDYVAAWQAGEAHAAARVIAFWGEPGIFESWPENVRAYVVRTTETNLRDWQTAFAFRIEATALAAIACPALVVHGSRAHPAARRIAEHLAAHIPMATRHEITGANHFMIATHRDIVADLIARAAHGA